MHGEHASFDRPFPALTPSQRLFLDVHGYVVVQCTLTSDEVARCRDAVYAVRDRLISLGERSKKTEGNRKEYLAIDKPHHHVVTNALAADPQITAYATHPRLVGMAEELIGGEARIVETNFHINRRDPEADNDRFDFHRGTDVAFASHEHDGLFHCNFVKTLTTLTDIGPDDGGTVVIPGSHKIDLQPERLIETAYEDYSLIHQIEAPAGSTLLFSETLIHATGHIRSDRERVIIICGYGPPMFPYWEQGGLSDNLVAEVPDHLKGLVEGVENWQRGPKYRRLADPADERTFALEKWSARRSDSSNR